MTVGQLLATISSRELVEWEEFYRWEHEQQEKAEREAAQRRGR